MTTMRACSGSTPALSLHSARAGETDDRAAALVKNTFAANEHVPAILAGEKRPVPSDSGYITMGGPDEATYYVAECRPAWHRTPKAVAWLMRLAAAAPKRRTRRPIN